MNKETMFYKDINQDVEVYNISFNGTSPMALIYDPVMAGRQNGNGWKNVKMSRLIPYPHAEAYKHGQTKTMREKAWKRLTLLEGEEDKWVTSNGIAWDMRDYEDAIACEISLIKKGERL